MKIFLLACALLFNSIIYAQIPTSKTLVADETWIVNSGNSSFRFITSNENIYHALLKEMQYHAYKVVSSLKQDRKGRYWEYTFYFKNEVWNDIDSFVKKLNT